jgi:glycine/D-amino acid oxidase-like deaminating enzyme
VELSQEDWPEKSRFRRAVPTEHHEVVIVGGGVAGLYTAYKLVQSGVTDIIVLEGRGAVGGRISTTRDADGNPLFNNFGWRVGEVNTQMIALAKELGITLIPQVTPPQDKAVEGKGQCRHGPGGRVCSVTAAESETYVVPPNRAPLSDFATACLIGAKQADKQDRESGYAGRTAQISWPDESHGTDAFVVEGGMDQYPNKLASKLPKGMVRLNHRVSNVQKTHGGYTVHVMKRNGNTYTPMRVTCDTVVLAAPPVSLRRLSVAVDMQPALFAVHQRRLGHVYVRCKDGITYPDIPDRSDVEDRIYRKAPIRSFSSSFRVTMAKESSRPRTRVTALNVFGASSNFMGLKKSWNRSSVSWDVLTPWKFHLLDGMTPLRKSS